MRGGINQRLAGLARAEHRRHALDPKREGLAQARRRLFFVGMARMRTWAVVL